MSLRAYLSVLKERWRLVVLTIALAVGVAVAITLVTPSVYQAQSTLYVSSNVGPARGSGQFDQQAAVQAQVATIARLVTTDAVVDAVRRDVRVPGSRNAIRSKLSAVAPIGQTLVVVQATDATASRSAAIANSAARALIAYVETQNQPAGTSTSTLRMAVVNVATVPGAPISPQPTRNVAFGVLIGLLLGFSLALARDALDNRVKSVEVLAELAGVPAMGVIVDDIVVTRPPTPSRSRSRSVAVENFRQLRANLQFANVDTRPRIIAVTSCLPGEGKTTVAVNLAGALAEAGFRVCLVDADLRRSNVATLFGFVGAVGLTNVLIRQLELGQAIQSAGLNLEVLCSGPTPPNPSELLASSHAREVMHSLAKRCDYVIVDTAPLIPVADGAEVAAFADRTLLVARYAITTQAQVRRAVDSLAHVDAHLMGVVLNRVPTKGSRAYEYAPYDTLMVQGEAIGPSQPSRPPRLRPLPPRVRETEAS